jgi:hypothetical protein
MWGGSALAKKWGATSTVGLNDGLGQGNNIAVFPTMVMGAAAQIDLWHTSKNYHNKRLEDAIHTWSGGNYVSSYLAFLMKRVPGLTPDTIIDDDFLKSGQGLAMMKAQAWHEAGKQYPMTDAEWREAQALVFSGKTPPPRRLPGLSLPAALRPVRLISPGSALHGLSPSESRSRWPPSSSGSSRNDGLDQREIRSPPREAEGLENGHHRRKRGFENVVRIIKR